MSEFFSAIDEFAAFAAPVGVVNDRVDLADVGVDAVAEKEHLQQRHDQRKKQRPEVAAHVQRLFIKDRAESTKNITHGVASVQRLVLVGQLDEHVFQAGRERANFGDGDALVQELLREARRD